MSGALPTCITFSGKLTATDAIALFRTHILFRNHHASAQSTREAARISEHARSDESRNSILCMHSHLQATLCSTQIWAPDWYMAESHSYLLIRWSCAWTSSCDSVEVRACLVFKKLQHRVTLSPGGTSKYPRRCIVGSHLRRGAESML